MKFHPTLLAPLAMFLFLSAACTDARFRIEEGQTVELVVPQGQKPVLYTAIDMFEGDLAQVLSATIHRSDTVSPDGPSIVLTLNEQLGREAFRIDVGPDNTLHICGGDAHGLAYGLLEVSRLMGVSPWEWWADATPPGLSRFVLSDYSTEQRPSVKFRGLFINDEDWGMNPWAGRTMEPEAGEGVIGPKTNGRIFELLLRLRANFFWPAMHGCTQAFFLTEGNREVAARYGIYVGGSHCEPMACNANGEWKLRGQGEYNYVTNAENVRKFWAERLSDVARQEIVYTLGMRGVHDGPMEGVKTTEERKQVLEQVIADQRAMLAEYVDACVENVPQVLIPYKEVLDIYEAGLRVPDDVTLMWCDDNYGFIRHFPNAEERARKGGNGIYYHVSYWGRPHDYCWLGTQSPALLYQQMRKAFERDVRQIWVLNVGDLKPAEYQLELFLDMAWDIEEVNRIGLQQHMLNFLSREFGDKIGRKLLPVMESYYRLAAIRRPEFMAGTRTEEADRVAWSTVHDMPWSEAYIDRRLADYAALSAQVDRAFHLLADKNKGRTDTYYQLVAYPVWASEQINRKFLYAQKARLHPDEADRLWEVSDAAQDSIHALTRTYNRGIANGGKWDGIMSDSPRNLTVFLPIDHDKYLPTDESRVYCPDECIVMDAASSTTGPYTVCPGLGHSGQAIELSPTTPDDEALTYTFRTRDLPHPTADSLTIEVLLIPSHPVDSETLTFSLSLDDGEAQTVDYQTYGRSEEWKRNILRGQAVRRFRFVNDGRREHVVSLRALTDGVLLDQIVVVN